MSVLRYVVFTVCVVLGRQATLGQDPFGGDPFAGGAAAPAAEAVPEEMAPDAAAAPRAAAGGAPPTEHPLLQALRESNPTTPSQLMRAVGIALDLGENAAAKEFLQRLQAANLDAAALTALVREFGSAAFVRIGRTTELDPEGRQFALSALKTADAVARDPARLQGIAEKLNDPSPQVRRAAVRELQRAGSMAVPPLVRILANDIQADIHPRVRGTLVFLGEPAIEPLLGVLDAPNPVLRVQVMQVLGELAATDARDLLVGPAVDPREDGAVREAASRALERIVGVRPHPADARDFLTSRIVELLDGELPRRPGVDGTIELWHWDAAQTAPSPQVYPAAVAGASLAARLAEDLYKIAPDSQLSRRLYLQSLLQAAKTQNRFDLPLPRGEGTTHARASEFGAAAIEDALAHAVRMDRIPAAIGAVEVLGDIGTETLVHSGTPQPTPLVAALSHKNQRLRLYAAEAIAKINPRDPFPNSSRYINTLARTVRTEALPRVIVAHPREEIAQTLAGALLQMGFEAEATYNGRQAYEAAARHPDTVFLLLSDGLDGPPLSQLVQLIRQDLRTADLPVAVMYRIEIEPVFYTSDTEELIAAAAQTDERVPGLLYKEHRLLDARRIAAGDPLTAVFPEIHEPATLEAAIARLAAMAGSDFITARERIYFAQVALGAFAKYAAEPVGYAFYEPARVQASIVEAIDQPGLAPYAARALGLLGTAQAQRTLVDVASQHARAIELRQAAAAAFREAVARQHLQLTTKEILLQYDRYNRSERLDRDTQVVLGHVLDTIEGARQEPPAPIPADVKEPSPAS